MTNKFNANIDDSEQEIVVTVRDTRYALRVIGEQYPELEKTMAIADSLLLNLSTIAHEVILPISLAIQKANEIDKKNLNGAIEMLSINKHKVHIKQRPLKATSINA